MNQSLPSFNPRFQIPPGGLRTGPLLDLETLGRRIPPGLIISISFTVKGTVVKRDGSPVTDQLVKAFDVDIRSEKELASARTSQTDGTYTILYTSAQLKRTDRASADLKICVYDKQNEQKIITSSSVKWNAEKDSVIDIIVEGDILEPSEFDDLKAKVLGALGDIKPEDVVEDDSHLDITHLMGATGEDRSKIEQFIAAYKTGQQTSLAPEILYGLYTQGQSTDPNILLGRNPLILKESLSRAVAAKAIRPLSENDVAGVLKTVNTAGITQAVQLPGSATRSPLGSLLATSTQHSQLFLEKFSNFEGDSVEEFWRGLDTSPEFKDKVPQLQQSIQLGVVTLSHIPLVQELQNRLNQGSLQDFSDLAKFSKTNWLEILRLPGIGTPAEIPGADEAEKSNNYASVLTRVIEDTFPAKYLASRIADANDESFRAFPAKPQVLSFFKKNPGFDFTSSRLSTFLAKTPDALKDIQNPDEVKNTVTAIQRLYSIAPQATQTAALVSDGVHSAMQVSRMGRSAFLARYSTVLGGQSEALNIFDRAEQAHAMSFNLLARFGWPSSKIKMPFLKEPIVSYADTEGAIPDMVTLFGSLDMCSCADCRSVDGPAAYLVDILHFLRDRKLIDKAGTLRDSTSGEIIKVSVRTIQDPITSKMREMSVKDVLFSRRPDLGEVELNCQNTNTPVPYIDLAMEVLENAISPLVPFSKMNLPTSAVGDLDKRILTSIRQAFTPPLSESAILTVINKGSSWIIDETAFTYSVRLESSKLEVQSRSAQTKGTAAERAANPQYMNAAAYNLLKQQVYPWKLPFDLWTETVRTYLQHTNVKRCDIMNALSTSGREATLERKDIAYESLNLTTFEVGLISGLTAGQPGAANSGVWNLWGFPSETLSPNNGIPDPANKALMIAGGLWSTILTSRIDVLLRQSGMKYAELLNLLQLHDIFGATSLVIEATRGADKDTCDLTKLQLSGANSSVLHRIYRFMKLRRKLSDWTTLELGQTYRTFGLAMDQTATEALLLALSHIQSLKNLLGLPSRSILAFWAPLSTVAYLDHEIDDEDAEPVSFFSELFRNRTVTNQQETVFTHDPNTLRGKLSENSATLTATLNISAVDLVELLADKNIVDNDILSINNLSKLYRHATLSTALGVGIPNYLSLLKIQPAADVFANTATTVAFVERVNKILSSGFSLVEMNYFLRHEFTVESGVSPSEDTISQLLGDLRTGLQKINKENTFEDDTIDDNGSITKAKLALLKWDPAIISQVIALLNDTVSFTTSIAAPLPDTYKFPDEIKDKITYDATGLKLSYSRVMTVADRELILNSSGSTTELKAAVGMLFTLPRAFFFRNTRTFSVPVYQASLPIMPATIRIPNSLRNKIYYDHTTNVLNSLGALTETERQSLLENANPVADVGYVNAVNDLYNGPDSLVIAAGDGFVDSADMVAMFNTVGTSTAPLVPRTRFEIVLKKLFPKLQTSLTSQLAVQRISQALGVESQTMEPLMSRWLKLGPQPVIATLLSHAYVNSNSVGIVTRKAFLAQFQAIELLTKIGMFVTKYKITKKQLRWIFELRVRANDPAVEWLDLNALPLQKTSGNAANFEGWEKIVDLFKLRDSLPLGEAVLDDIFSQSRAPGASLEGILAKLCERMKWSLPDIKELVGSRGLNLTSLAAFQSGVGIDSILRCVDLFRKIGCSVRDGILYSQAEQGELQALAIVQTMKSKYDQTLWMTVARPLRNILRDKQRASLVSYLLAHPLPGVLPIWRNSNDLYAYYLIDVEMGPCQLTSRIKQAISVTQLFVQRCLMNLEPEVTVDAEWDIRWNEWKTLKSFRLTSASRQVFEKPENFLDSSLRDDKTPFFKDFEGELQQNDLTQDVAENALSNYLEKLDAVSHLDVVGYYHQEEGDDTKTVDILHVFARSFAQPPIYYYRKRVDSTEWTAWEKVDVEITTDHLIPVVWKRRLYLFWAMFSVTQAEAPITLPGENKPLPKAQTYWQVKLGWSELKNGKWLAKTVSDSYILLWKSTNNPGVFDVKPLGVASQRSSGPHAYTFKTIGGGDNDKLRIECITNNSYAGNMGYFEFDDVKSNPRTGEPFWDPEEWPLIHKYVLPPLGTKLRGMTFMEEPNANGEVKLVINTSKLPEDSNSQQASKLSALATEVTVLKKTPGIFKIIPPHQDPQFDSRRPFFYQHSNLSFFVEPSLVASQLNTRFELANRYTTNPLLLDGSLYSQYVNKPAKLIPQPTVPGRHITGPVNSLATFELGQNTRILSGRPVLTTQQVQSLKLLPNPVFLPPNVDLNNFQTRILRSDIGIIKGIDTNIAKLGLKKILPETTLDIARTRFPIFTGGKRKTQYKFSVFYHPWVSEFVRSLNRDGVEGLLARPLQLSQRDFFESTYEPNPNTVMKSEWPVEEVDMDNGAMSQYNWELFYHIPLMIAERLSKNQKFEDALKWFHFIFDPTDNSAIKSPARFWRMKKFFETDKAEYSDQAIQNLFRFLATAGDPAAKAQLTDEERKHLEALEMSVARWRKDPFNPFLVARTRSVAFQKSLVMKYLDNLIAWGDQLFRMDTIESINEATQLFILASDILGDRPAEIPVRAEVRVQTYNSLEPKLDSYSNALVQIEELVPPRPLRTKRFTLFPRHQVQVATSTMLYFCVPKNDKLLSYWDTISDRLFKIRNCMNLQGVVRELALFEPPIDPALLIKASAAGADISSVLGDLSAPLPYYRYSYMAAKAKEICSELRELGAALTSALEKRDAESVALLRQTHETRTLDSVRHVKVTNIGEAQEALTALEKGKEVVQARNEFYSSRAFMNPWEITSMSLEGAALVLQIIEAATQPVAAATAIVPELKIGAPTSLGATWGGQNLSKAAAYFGAFLNRGAGILNKGGAMASTMGGHWRRKEEWDHNANLAQKELVQFDFQIAGATLRKSAAEKELKNHDLQINNAKEMDAFMRSKYTNRDLYEWMTGQLSTLYFQTYQMAFDVAKRAERAYAYELGLTKGDFIQFGYWDSLKKGLLAAENLSHDLKRMDMSYIELDRREYEITRSVSLLQLDPVALIQLVETGECFFTLPEALFDLDFPGHYFRRIKTVSLTIPCVTGPYTSISSTLTLLKSSVRTSSIPFNNGYARRDNDIRFSDNFAQAQSIVTSSALNDAGLFEVNFHDERYLPFERAGAISSWRLQLSPPGFSSFDARTISDVIIQVRYTAREAGEPLRSLATNELRTKTLNLIARAEGATGLARMFSLRHEFPDAWHRLFYPGGTSNAQEMVLPMAITRFPFLFRGAQSLSFSRAELFIRVRQPYVTESHAPGKLRVMLAEEAAAGTAVGAPIGLTPWSGVLRGAKPLGKPAGTYKLRMELDGGGKVLDEAIEEIMLVIHYGVKWA